MKSGDEIDLTKFKPLKSGDEIDTALFKESSIEDKNKDVNALTAAIHGIGQGVTLGLADEATAAIQTLGGKLGLGDKKSYEENVKEVRERMGVAKKKAPGTAATTEVAGNLLTGGKGWIAKGLGSLGKKAGQAVPYLKKAPEVTKNIIAGAAQGAGEGEGLQGKVTGALMGGATAAGIGGAAKLAQKGLSDLASNFSLRAVTPRFGEIKQLLKNKGVSEENMEEALKGISERIKKEAISARDILPGGKTMYQKIKGNVKDIGAKKGSIIDENKDLGVNAKKLYERILGKRPVSEESLAGDPAKHAALLETLDERVLKRASPSGEIPVGLLDKIQQRFKGISRTQSGAVRAGKEMDEAARKGMTESIAEKIGEASPEKKTALEGLNKDFSFWKGLVKPASGTMLRENVGATQAREMSNPISRIAMNPKSILGNIVGEQRAAAIAKKLSESGKTGLAFTRALQNIAIQAMSGATK